MKKCFACRDAFQSELPLLLGEDNNGNYGLVASVNGSFEQTGGKMLAIIDTKSPAATTRHFKDTLGDLMHYLKTDYANALLTSAEKMCILCDAYADEQDLFENGQKIIGFETHTDTYQFYIKCVPNRKKIEKSRFSIHCYDRKSLLAAGMIADEESV